MELSWTQKKYTIGSSVNPTRFFIGLPSQNGDALKLLLQVPVARPKSGAKKALSMRQKID